MIDYLFTKNLVPYEEALHFMESRVFEILKKGQRGLVWGLQHPPLYTVGRRAMNQGTFVDLPVYEAKRGGLYTYHGPGQLVVYVMVNLNEYACDLRWFMTTLQKWCGDVLADFGLPCVMNPENIGVWCESIAGIKKIGSLGVHVRQWVTSHGIALNVSPDMKHFEAISPCGLSHDVMSSLLEQGINVSCEDLFNSLMKKSPF